MDFGLSRQRRYAIVGIAAVIYGLGVAFGGSLWGDTFGNTWTTVGSFVGALFLVLMVIPFFTIDRTAGHRNTAR